MHNLDLNKSELMDILQLSTIDTGSGTLFGVPQRRGVNTTRLTLVISTGGSGKQAIQQAINTARQKLAINYSNYMKFLVLDSATGELEELRKKGIDILNISGDNAQDRLSYEKRPLFYRKFISKDFPVTSINSEGSSQIRQIGKVKLYDANGGSTNDQLLQQKIKGYFDGDWAAHKTKKVDIMILTGISGGNGSGTFLDIAVRAKKACPYPANVTVYGYIMLPDTAEIWASDQESKNSLYVNGFAALKELESYESIGMEGNRKEIMPSNTPAYNVELTNTNMPYDYPVLLSGDYYEAVGMIAETIVNAAADNGGDFSQLSFYSNRDRIKTNKLARNVVSQLGELNPSACPEDSHMYCSIGYAQASIPEKVVIPHVVAEVCQKLYIPQANDALSAEITKSATAFCTENKSLSRDEFQSAMRQLIGLKDNEPLDKESLWKKISVHMSKHCKLGDNPVDITINDIIEGKTANYKEAFKVTAVTNKATEEMGKVCVAEFENLKTRAKGLMKKYGPRVMYYLYEGIGNPGETGKNEDYSEYSLRTQIQFVANKFLEQRPGIQPKTPDPQGLFGKIKELFLKTEYEKWVKNTRKCETENVRYEVAKNMKGVNGVWNTKFVVPLEDLLWNTERFASVLEYISNYYAGVGHSLSEENYEKFSKQSGEINGINLCNDAGMYKWVRGKINDKLANVNVQKAREDIIEDFYNNTSLWVSNDRGKARTQFDEIMSDVCQVGKHGGNNNGMNLTITDYFEHLIETIAPAEQQNQVNLAIHSIFEQLMTRSKPSLIVKQDVKMTCNGTIMLPKNLETGKCGTLVKNAFSEELKNGGSIATSLVYSDVVDSIVCYQTSVANALSDIEDLKLWEDAYNNVKDETKHLHSGEYVSLHMNTGYSQYNELKMSEMAYEMQDQAERPVYADFENIPNAEILLDRLYGTGLSWEHYPSINVARYGNTFSGATDNLPEFEFRKEFEKEIEEAERIGVIECEKKGNNYKYFINLIPDDWTKLSVKGYRVQDKATDKFVRGREMFEHLKKQNPHSAKEYRQQIFLRNSEFFGAQGFDFTELINVKHWEQQRVDRECRAYMLRMMRKSTGLYQDMKDTMWKLYPLEAQLETKEQGSKLKRQYKVFLEAFLHGLINANEEKTIWTAVTDDNGDTEDLFTIGRRTIGKLSDIEKNLLNDGFKLKLVYDRYVDLRLEFDLSDDRLNAIEDRINKNLSDKEYDKMVDERIAYLQTELDKYKEKYGNQKDPLDEIMKAYGLSDYQMDDIQPVLDFYAMAERVIEEQHLS